jgi:hypothetical protein
LKRTEETQVLVWFSSEIHPEIRTRREDLAEVIEWADANPKVWRIVRENKSKAFGQKSSMYLGYQRGPSPSAALDRATRFGEIVKLERSGSVSIFTWSARFTLENYGAKGFKSGFFRQFDGTHDRGCCYLDYTPETLNIVIDRFLQWCGNTFETQEVRVDGKTVRTVTRNRG